MTAALVLVLILVATEYLFWLSPLAAWFQGRMEALGDWYYLVPFHYIFRMVVLAGVIVGFRPATWPVFGGGAAGWGWSLAGGLLLMAANLYIVGLRPTGLTAAGFLRKAEGWRRAAGWRYWAQTGYVIGYPGFVEELLFRWFLPAALWPALGWWVLLGAPAAMMLWHIPVWSRHFAPGKALALMVLQATVYCVLLTLIAVLTQNIAGCILAHAFGDWTGSVLRWSPKKRAAA